MMLTKSRCFAASATARTFAVKAVASKAITPERHHGNLSDKDRIFTNIYNDQDPFLKGALKRVSLFSSLPV